MFEGTKESGLLNLMFGAERREAMPESVSVMKNRDIIQITSWGHITREDMQATTQEIMALCRENEFTKIFVDMRKAEKLPGTEALFEVAVNSRNLSNNQIKTAVLVSEAVKADRKFAEDVAVNRGSVEKIFDTKVEALAWLEK
jgi:hypothetical protein